MRVKPMVQNNYEEQRKAPRKNIPTEIKGYIEIYNEEDILLFKAPIADISILGAGITLTQGMNQLLSSLKIVKNFYFPKALVRLDKLLIQTGIIWVWNHEGKSGIQFFKMIDEDQKALDLYILSLPE